MELQQGKYKGSFSTFRKTLFGFRVEGTVVNCQWADIDRLLAILVSRASQQFQASY